MSAADVIRDAILYARINERVAAVIPTLKAAVEGISRIADLDPALEPELMTALDHLEQTLAALARANDFADARLEAKVMNDHPEQAT